MTVCHTKFKVLLDADLMPGHNNLKLSFKELCLHCFLA